MRACGALRRCEVEVRKEEAGGVGCQAPPVLPERDDTGVGAWHFY